MKKVLLAFAVATVFAACDDSSKTDSTTTTDSSNVSTGTTDTSGTSTGTMTDTSRMSPGYDTARTATDTGTRK